MNETITKVIQWASMKGIFKHSDQSSQMLKTIEEVGELASAINIDDQELIKDALGDILVTLIIQAEMNGLKIQDCLESVYEVISKRQGEMVNGVFVKE